MWSTMKPDKGRAWTVLATCFFIMFINAGFFMGASGVYVAAMIEYYHSSKVAGYIIGCLVYTITYVIAPFVGRVIERTSHRTVIIIGSILSTLSLLGSANVNSIIWQYCTWTIAGIGCGFINQGTLMVIPLYFVKYVSLAMSIVIAGFAVGLLVTPIIALSIVEYYSWQPSLYIVAGLNLNICVGAFLILPMKATDSFKVIPAKYKPNTGKFSENFDKGDNIHLKNDGKEMDIEILELNADSNNDNKNCGNSLPGQKSSNSIVSLNKSETLMHNTDFWLFVAGAFLVCGSSSVPFLIGADIYNDNHITTKAQSQLYLMLGVSNISGRFLSGFILHFKLVSPLNLFMLSNTAWTLFLLPLIFPQDFNNLIIFNIGFGLFYGISLPALPLTTLSLVGVKLMNRAFGWLMVSSLSAALIPPLMGWLYDQTQTYLSSILLAIITSLCGSVILLLVSLKRFCKKHRHMKLTRQKQTRDI